MKNFETRLERLEQLNGQLKEEHVPLDDAFTLFEEGIKLAKSLEKDLEKAEKKIEILVNQPEKEDGKVNLELFSADGPVEDPAEE